jgi:hypothetical protein
MATYCCGGGSRATVMVNGLLWETEEGIEWDLLAYETESIITQSGRQYPKRKPSERAIRLGNLVIGCGFDVSQLEGCNVGVSVYESENNITHIFGGCFIKGKPVYKPNEGVIDGIEISFSTVSTVRS